MSALLESLITDDTRLKDLAANDAAEAEALAADVAANVNKAWRKVREAVDRGVEQQAQMWREAGVL